MALLFAVLVPLAAQAYFDGIAKTTGCGACHGNKATASLSVSVSGPTELSVSGTGTYTLTIVDPGGFAGGAFSVASTDQNNQSFLTATDANTAMANGNVSHVNAGALPPGGNIGVWSYNFDLTAPAYTGSVTLSFAGLAFDGGMDKAGDIWNVGSFGIGVVASVPEPATGLLVSLGIGMLAVAGRRRKA